MRIANYDPTLNLINCFIEPRDKFYITVDGKRQETQTVTEQHILKPDSNPETLTPCFTLNGTKLFIAEAFNFTLSQLTQPWKQKYSHLTKSIIYKEHTWWNVDRLPFVEPKPNTNLLYITYIPHSEVIKVGRTQNWVSRKNTYHRNNGSTPETTGDYFWVYDKNIRRMSHKERKRILIEFYNHDNYKNGFF